MIWLHRPYFPFSYLSHRHRFIIGGLSRLFFFNSSLNLNFIKPKKKNIPILVFAAPLAAYDMLQRINRDFANEL